MIVCVCRNLNQEYIKDLKARFGTGYLAALAQGALCGNCVKYCKQQDQDKELQSCRTCDIIKEQL